MTRKIVYLFPDTNLFVQGRPLEDLDWSEWAEFDEVQLIVTRPVQKEIDNQKNRGRERLGRRARSTSSLFRETIQSDQDHKLVRDAGPCVKLFIKPEYTPSPALSDRLNYQERDDQLVGTVYAFKQQHPDADARLLTHDTGPMATAQMVGVPVAVIPDDWLLSPESSQEEKKIGALESELARLKKSAPDFHIKCLDGDGNEIEKLHAEFVRYEALTDEELAALMDRVKVRFPVATDFGKREPAARKTKIPGLNISGPTETFTPATDEEIAAYRDEKHPAWLEQCEDILRKYHDTVQRQAGPLTFRFVVSNEGTRPGKDALITIEAKGKFEIRPPARNDDGDDESDQQDRIIELPPPPTPPRGKWRTTMGRHADDFDSLTAFQRSLRAISGLDPIRSLGRDLHIPRLGNLNSRRDPNAFYWKPQRPVMPQTSFSLECEQWRHGIDTEFFDGEIYFADDVKAVSGALECRIQAENLSNIARKRVPVRIEVKRVSIIKRADKLVDWLGGPGEGQSKNIPES